jgi:DNA-binding IclR family transcriptional regulator
MDENFDRTKVVDCMFDPITSLILAELEDGEKQCSFLAQQADIPESEVLERLSYLLEHDFVFKNSENDKCTISANSEKLSTLLEDSSNFDDAISGLEKLDTYLN